MKQTKIKPDQLSKGRFETKPQQSSVTESTEQNQQNQQNQQTQDQSTQPQSSQKYTISLSIEIKVDFLFFEFGLGANGKLEFTLTEGASLMDGIRDLIKYAIYTDASDKIELVEEKRAELYGKFENYRQQTQNHLQILQNKMLPLRNAYIEGSEIITSKAPNILSTEFIQKMNAEYYRQKMDVVFMESLKVHTRNFCVYPRP